jgi:V-type H+-transporting ATPase subunit D
LKILTLNLILFRAYRNLQLYKTKAVGAKKGFELLKKKSDALKKAFRAILQKIVEAKIRMGY